MRPFLAVVGATGTGKTAVSLALSKAMPGTEIVCCDSRQLFRGLDAATGKPTAAERSSVPHHLFDELDPGETAERPSAGWYARRAAPLLTELLARGKTPLVVGGTGLYLKALYRGLAPIPEIPQTIRDEVRAALAERGSEGAAGAGATGGDEGAGGAERAERAEKLHAELATLDPETAARLSPRDRQRVARALEVVRGTGRPLSAWLRERPVAPLGGPERWRLVALHLPRPALYQRLDARTRSFFEDGLLTETRAHLARGVSPDAPGLASLGYAQAVAHLAGRVSLAEAIALAQRETRRYAKRQETWWRHEGPRAGVHWLSIEPDEPADHIAQRFSQLFE
jgi:tRNA dimethylallyltransferase